MTQRERRKDPRDGSRRSFLQTVGASVPTLTMLAGGMRCPAGADEKDTHQSASMKFTPIDLSRVFNCSAKEYGPQEQAMGMGGVTGKDGLIRTPAGRQNFQGIPFLLGPEGLEEKRWLALSNRPKPWFTHTVDIHVGKQAAFLCVAAFCDWDENENTASSDPDVVMEKVGQQLAQAVLLYDNGERKELAIRRRFEVGEPLPNPHVPFAAVPYMKDIPVSFSDPLRNSAQWGDFQQGVIGQKYPRGADGRMFPVLWGSALANPDPARVIETLRLNAAADDALIVCGLTLFHGKHNPFVLERLNLYRLTLPEATAEDMNRWKVGRRPRRCGTDLCS